MFAFKYGASGAHPLLRVACFCFCLRCAVLVEYPRLLGKVHRFCHGVVLMWWMLTARHTPLVQAKKGVSFTKVDVTDTAHELIAIASDFDKNSFTLPFLIDVYKGAKTKKVGCAMCCPACAFLM
jgi:hypothetical protein